LQRERDFLMYLPGDLNTEQPSDEVSKTSGECANKRHPHATEKKIAAGEQRDQGAHNEQSQTADKGARKECGAAAHQQIRQYGKSRANSETDKRTCGCAPRGTQRGRI